MTENNGATSQIKATSNGMLKNSDSTTNHWERADALRRESGFDQPIILKQSPIWSRAILWGIMGVTTFGIVWACVAKIEEAIPAKGQLEPQGIVKEVQAPVGGVVAKVHVEEGEHVSPGKILLELDTKDAQAQITSLNKIRASLIQENQFYRSQIKSPAATEPESVSLQLRPEIEILAKNRVSLISENQLYRAQLGDVPSSVKLSPQQLERLRFNQSEANSRIATANLEISQLLRQLEQNQIQLANAKAKVAVEGDILGDIEPLAKVGAVPKLQYRRQQQEVRTRQAELNQLNEESGRLKSAIAQAKEKLATTIAVSKTEPVNKIADNEKRLAEIDSQLTKVIVENEKKIADIDSQLSKAQQILQYQAIRSPVAGTVFELKAHTPGFVATSSEPVMKVVPDDTLVAKVFITNKDIGFVKEGMKVDVRIDSFSFSEFGDIKGKLVSIGSDALPPDQVNPYYRFPTKISLDSQSFMINGKAIPLRPGMSVNANIKVREDRPVISIFTDFMMKKVDSLKQTR